MKKETATKEENKIIEVKRFTKVDGGKKNSPLRGFATCKILDCITIQGVKLLEYKDSYACEFPTTKGKDSSGADVYYPVAWLDLGDKDSNKEIYEKITEALVKAFENA